MKKILALPGDGIGAEVMESALEILDYLMTRDNLDLQVNHKSVGGTSYEEHGLPITDEALSLAKDSDAILFGAIGDPKYDNDPSAKIRPEQGLLKMRQSLGLFANIRPTFTFPSLLHHSPLKKERIEGTNLVFLRELTGGIYFGEKGRKDGGNSAFDICSYNKEEVKRLAKKGFELAMNRDKKLCCVDKANVLETSRLWRETVQEMEKDFPKVEVSYEFVDAVAMRLVQWPNSYDVLITENLFGE